jgi:hypothetical protein
MSRRIAVVAAALLISAAACSREPTAPVPPETFTGSWRSVTAPYEHLRLKVDPPSTVTGAMHLRITFSGVAWEGASRIEGDSLIMDVSTSSQYGAKVVAHPAEGGSLRVQVGSSVTGPMTAIFVRGE